MFWDKHFASFPSFSEICDKHIIRRWGLGMNSSLAKAYCHNKKVIVQTNFILVECLQGYIFTAPQIGTNENNTVSKDFTPDSDHILWDS